LKLLQDLNVNKSPGPDGLHPTDMLKELSEALVKPLTEPELFVIKKFVFYHMVYYYFSD
jgi:hypothetical protein